MALQRRDPVLVRQCIRNLLDLSLTWRCDWCSGQWIESVTDWAIRITDWGLFPDWVSSHARLADPIRPMPNKGKPGLSGLPIALISRPPDWVVQSVLPIAIAHDDFAAIIGRATTAPTTGGLASG